MAREIVGYCLQALRNNLGLRRGERVVVITDSAKLHIGRAFAAAARELTSDVTLQVIPVSDRNGEEPPAGAASLMASANVVVMPLCSSLSWTAARSEATRNGARVASLPGITETIIRRTFPVEYDSVRRRANRVCDRLDAGREVWVRSDVGTDLTLTIAGRRAHGRKGGIYRRSGEWGNLPCGEAFIAPVEGTACGVYVVDGSHGGVGKLSAPIRIEVDAGRAVAMTGGNEARRLRALLESTGDPAAFHVAELGIGCNHGARVTGVTLEDEKALGSCHVALGSNALFGGTIRAGIHVDGVLRDPELRIDGARILGGGHLEI